MTYVEFFDKADIENIGPCLTNPPEKVVLIGKKNTMEKHISRYKRIFEGRKQKIEFIPMEVTNSNLENAVTKLSTIISTAIENNDNCVFDITGGEEVLCVALGIVAERYKEKQIQIHKFDIKEGTVYDCDKDGTTIFKELPYLSIAENIILHGGDIVFNEASEEKSTCVWDLTDDFEKDVESIWSICKGNARLWNVLIGWFGVVNDVGSISEDGLTITAKTEAVNNHLGKTKSSYRPIKGMINSLSQKGLIKDFTCDNKMVCITYKNPQVKKCLTKAGQALEMKIFLTAKSLQNADGTPVYNDVMNGVVIDWDGKFHDEDKEKKYDTENEIDVILMHGLVPVFISCKNGDVDVEELYKLNTVANRFGGKYVKKVLIATSIQKERKKDSYLLQRAEDMGIRVICNIQEQQPGELRKTLRNLWAYTQ